MTGHDNLLEPPQSVDAEQAVLGGLLLDSQASSKVSDILSSDDFYLSTHREVYQVIMELVAGGRPYDALTAGDLLYSRTGNPTNKLYVIDLATNTPGASNIRAYAEIVREKSLLRKIIATASEAVNGAFSGKVGSKEILSSAIREMMRLGNESSDVEMDMKAAAKLAYSDMIQAYENRGVLRGITTGFADINRRMGGFHNGDLIFIGARPSMGKTALCINMANAQADAGHVVGIISGEQSAMQLAQRAYAMRSGVAAENLRNGNIDEDEWGRLSMATMKLVKSTMRIYDRPAPTLDDIARIARRWKQENGLAILHVDYLQRIRFPDAGNRIEEVAEVARGLKTLARELEIPIVALAQVKAEVDKRVDKRPNLGDIANSDEATREADQIWFLYRDEVYDRNSHRRGIAELNVEKNRHGPTGGFDIRFEPQTMVFRDMRDEFDR